MRTNHTEDAMNRFRVYCGPTLTHTLCALLRCQGVEVTVTGTEHLHVVTNCTAEELVRLLNTVMSGFSYRDVLCLNHCIKRF
jgi:hypothetical protein